MNPNRRNLLIFSKFAQKAKKYVGSVKSAEILNNSKYANDILINAVLSGDNELIELSKLMFDEVSVDRSLICSVETYMIKVKDVSLEHLHQSKYFIVKFTKFLLGIDINGVSYRNAVEQLLNTVETKDRTYCINLARAFYPIWRNGYKLQKETTNVNTETQNVEMQDLIHLWENIESESFSEFENWPLNVYINSMRQINVSEKEINTRAKIAKLISIKLRGSHNDLKSDYRTSVESLELLFSNQNLKEYYLVVSREYFRFLMGDFPQISTT